MAKPKKTRAQLEAENEYLKRGHLAESLAAFGSTAFKWGSLSFIFWCLQGMVVAIAGKQTFASVAFAFLTDIKIDRWSAYALASFGLAYGQQQRALRKRNISRFHRRIEEFETQADKGRSSSELTERGDTRPEEKR